MSLSTKKRDWFPVISSFVKGQEIGRVDLKIEYIESEVISYMYIYIINLPFYLIRNSIFSNV